MQNNKIPPQLQQDEYRFIKVAKQSKRPIENNWQETANYQWNNKVLQAHLQQGGNYGVLGGVGGLVIIDCDQQQVWREVEKHLPQTLTIKTGSDKKHYYFKCENFDAPIRLMDTKAGDLGDIQSKGRQVVGAGSIHPNGKTYSILKDLPIAMVGQEQIKLALRQFTIQKKEPLIVEEKQALEIPITDVVNLNSMKKQGDEYFGKHPVHGSDGGQNFWINPQKNTWHCFRHDTGGGSLSLIAVQEGIIDCSEAVSGGLKGEKFIETIKVARSKYGLEGKKKEVSTDNITNSVLTHLLLREKQEATELMVEYILSKEYIYTTRDDDKAEIWIYYEGVYIPNGRTFIEQHTRKILGKAYSTPICNQIIAKIMADTYINQDEFFNQQHTEEIVIENGLLNLFTRELSPFTPEKIFFNKIPITYNPEQKGEEIINFFKSIVKDEREIQVIQEIFGFCLYDEYFLEKSFMFLGGGRNGKGKTLSLLKKFLGIESCSEIPLEELEKDNFAMGELFKKKANLCGDLSPTALKTTGAFKKLTGRDLISANRKFKTRVNFVNYAKFVFSANQLPITHDLTEAFFNRWIIIKFPYTFLPQKEIDEREEQEGLKLQDPAIIEKIATNETMAGLLNQALDGLQRIIENKSFSYSPSTSETKRQWLRESDSCQAFVMDCIERGDNSITKEKFREIFANYCFNHGIVPSSDKSIKYVLTTTFGVAETYEREEEMQKTCWKGIMFKEGVVAGYGL